MALLSGFDELNSANATFSDWLTKTNELILLMRGANTAPSITSVMTANSLPGGSMTFGNATLFGQFTANTMVVLNDGENDGSDDNVFANGNFGGLRGGVWNNASNTITADTLYIVSNTTYTDESVEVYVDSTYGLIVEQNIEARHDVLFVGNGGSNTNPKMHWEDADNILSFNNNVRAVFGKNAGSEVVGGTGQAEFLFVDADNRMYVNTENMNIRANTDVNFITDNFELKSDIGSELYISADVADNSTVKLYYEGNERLATNTHGIVVTGDAIVQDDLVMFDGGRIMMGNTYPYDGTQDIASYNFQIYTDGTDGIIVSGDKDLNIFVHEGFNLTNEPGTINFITANNDGSSEVVLYNNGTARLETTGAQAGEVPGVEIFGEANTTTLRVRQDANFDNDTLNSNSVHWDATNEVWNYRDSVKATFGDSDDWEMFYTAAGRAYSNTDNQDIRARTDLNVISNIVEMKSETGGELYISADVADNSTVKLYYEGNVRLSTNTHGIEVDGDVVVKDNTVIFDNNKLLMGGTYPYTGGEAIADYNFQIYTDGTDGIIVSGDKDLNIFVHEGFNLTNEPGTVSFITANNDGSSEVVLYNNGTARLETTGSQVGEVPGVEIHGEANTDTLRVEGDVRFDGSTDGITTTLNANNIEWTSLSNTMNFDDNTYLEFGTSGDFKIHHDGSHTYMQDTAGVGNVYLDTNTFIVRNAAGNENLIRAIQDDGVTLYFNNSQRLDTTNLGVDIEGEANTDTLRVQANATFESDAISPNEAALEWNSASRVLDWNDNARARFGNGVDLQIWHSSADNSSYIAESGAGNLNISGTNINIEAQDGSNYITAVDDGSVSIFFAGDGVSDNGNIARLTTTDIGVDIEGEANTDTLRVQGDVAIEDGTGTVEVTWDASNSRMNFVDEARLRFGDSADLQIWHSGTASWIADSGTGNLFIEGTNLVLRATDDTRYLVGTDGTGVEIYSPDDSVALTANNNQIHITDLANTNTLRVRGTSLFENDISIEGSDSNEALDWDKSANTLNFNDDNYATFGTSSDLQLYHDGTNSFIKEQGTGQLNIDGSVVAIRDVSDGTTIAKFTDGAGADISYNGTVRMSTDDGGITVTGNTVADGFVAGDNEKLQLGNAQDLELYHDASDSRIDNKTGNLVIRNASNDADVIIQTDDGSGSQAVYFQADGSTGSVKLFHYGATKLTTTSIGVDLEGQANTDTLRVQSTSDFEGSINIQGSNDTDTLTWTKSSNTLNFDDNNFATFGNDSDLSIYHDGDHSFISDTGTGALRVLSNDIIFKDSANTETMARFVQNGAVTLYFDNSQKFITTNTGATLTGTLIADGVTVGDNEIIQLGTTMQLYNDGSTSYINETGSGSLTVQANNLILEDTGGDDFVTGVAGGTVRLYYAGAYKLETDLAGVNVNGSLDVSSALTVGGVTSLENDIDIQGSTGADTLTWDKSANTLNFDDNNFATFGTGADMSLYHNGTNSFIENTTGELFVKADGLTLRSTTNEDYLTADLDGGVTLYFNNSEKLATTNTGATLTGTLIADGVTVGDDEIIQLGTTMQLYNDGANSYITESGSGNFNLQANSVALENTDGGNYFTGVANGAAIMYHAGTARVSTTSSGASITGALGVTTNLTVTGSTSLNGTVDLGNAASDNIDFNGRVRTSIVPNANNTRDLGSSTLVWNDIYSGGAFSGNNGTFTGDLTVSGNTAITGNTSASHFIGNGSQLTDLNGTAITTGTVDAARIDAELTSNTSGTAATATQPAVTDSSTDTDFRVTFASNTGQFRDLYADSTFLYNPADNALYVDNLIVNTEITLPDNITAQTVSAVDFSVSNTATILNLEVTSLEANGVAFTGTGGDVTTTASTMIDSFPIEQTRGYKYFVHGEVTNDDTKGYAVEINVITTDTGADTKIFYTRYGEVENGMGTVEVVPELASNNTHIDLMATCPAATASAIHRFNVLKIETRDNGV